MSVMLLHLLMVSVVLLLLLLSLLLLVALVVAVAGGGGGGGGCGDGRGVVSHVVVAVVLDNCGGTVSLVVVVFPLQTRTNAQFSSSLS